MNFRKSIFAICVLIVSTHTIAETMKAPTLKEIMQDLRDNLVEITDGLLVDDFDRIANGAMGIAQHARIPASQVTQIADELGPEMAAFKLFDEQVHGQSMSMATAAKDHDRNAMMLDYQRMVEGCLACHVTFKNRVSEVLSKASE